MMTRNLLVRCAPFAIAASGALYATSAIAQDAAPAEAAPIVLPPVTTTAPAPAPVAAAPIVLPDVSTVQAAPVEEPAPAAGPAATQQAQRATPAARTTSSNVSTRTASAPASAPVAQADTAAPAAVALPATTEMAPVLPVAAEPVAAPAETAPVASNDVMDEAIVAGLLGALGLAAVGGIAFASSRRRRRRALGQEAYEPTYDEATIVEEPVYEPAIVEPTPVVAPKPTYVAPAMASTAYSGGDPVALPSDVPPTVEERVALIDRLVAAEPDRANPFTSRKARAKRARMIVNSLGRSFRSTKPRIDLSEYTNRWPSLRGWQPATA